MNDKIIAVDASQWIPEDNRTTLKQNIARLPVRAAESIAGIPGDIGSLVGAPLRSITPNSVEVRTAQGPRKLSVTPEKAMELPLGGKVNYGISSSRVPTSSDIRGVVKKTTGDYFEPAQGKDTYLDKVASDLAPLILGAGSAPKAALGIAKYGPYVPALVKAFGGNLVAQGLEQLGANEAGQALGKLAFNIGSIFPGSRSYFTKEAIKAYQAGDAQVSSDIWHGIKQADKVTDFLKKHASLGKYLKNTTAKSILLGAGLYNPVATAKKAATVIGAGGAAHTLGRAIKPLIMGTASKNIRNTYFDILKSAAANDVTATKRHIKHFDQLIDRYEKHNPEEELITIDSSSWIPE